MPTQKVNVDIENSGAHNRSINWNGNVENTEVGLLALTFNLVAADGESTYIEYLALDTMREWNFIGSKLNTDSSSPGYNTHWHLADKNNIILPIVTQNPVSPQVGQQWLVQEVITSGQATGTLGMTYTNPINTDNYTLNIKTNTNIKTIKL